MMDKIKTNLVTEYWYYNPITYDKNKYSYEIVDKTIGDFRLFEKNMNQTIFYSSYITMLEQINTNEFVVIYPEDGKLDSEVIFEHFCYNEQNKKTKTIFKQKYNAKSTINPSEQIRKVNDVYVLDGFLDTTIYNPKTRKNLSLEKLEIFNESYTDNQQKHYLIGNITIEVDNDYYFKDNLTMYININTLEFNGFCSRIQGERFIPIIKNTNKDFITNYNDTVEEEVVKYLELLEEQEEHYQEQSLKKAKQILIKKLTSK